MRRAARVFALIVLLSACSKQNAGSPDASDASGGAAPLPASAAPASVPSATDVMSAASPSWDAGPKVHPTGEVDGASLRRTTRARLASDRSPVTFLQGGTPRELGERLCTDVVPQRPKETPILIKPNLGGFEWFKDPAKNHGDDGLRGRITDPEFVRGIVRCLKARGHDAITIAEGWGATHADWEKLVRLSGYAAMARDENVRLVAMDDDGVFDVEGDTPGKPLRVTGMEQTHTPTLLMPKVLAEHLQRGLFISAPKIKAHRFGVFSAAIKGGQGVVMLSDASPAFHQKWRMHGELGAALKLLAKDKDAGNKAYLRALDLFAERMSDVLEVAAPHVVLAEGAPLEGGDGFAKRWPSAENIAIGGTNPIMVDRVVAAALGLWDNAELGKNLGGHKTSPLLEVAAKRFGIDVSTPAIQGDGASLLMTPRPVHFVSMSGFALHSDASPPEIAPGAPADHAEHAASEMHAARVDDASIVIDGVAEAAWNKAPAITFDTDWSGARTPASTRVRALWSTRALYMLFEIENTGFHVDASRPVQTERDKLYEEDCVEIFVGTDPGNKNRYYEIEVGPLGHFFDLAIDRTKHLSDAAWSSDPVIATKVDREHRRATIEIALRSRDITAAFTPGARLPFALYRMEGKAPRLYLAWRPTRTPKPNFHVPEAFGTLVLDAPATR